MAYRKDVWRFPGSNEYEYKFIGNYGAKGEKRHKKQKASPEQIRKQNQRNKEKRIRRLIKANFKEGDMWVTLKYSKGTRKNIEEVKDNLTKFLNSMRTQYKKRGHALKFIYRMEVGAKGGVHIHILINRIDQANTDEIITKCWKRFGHVNYQNIYEAGGYADLAAYIVKEYEENTEEYEQLSLFEEYEQKELIKYSSSRNLIRPEPERTDYSRRTVRKLIDDGPKPAKGYFIDPDSIVKGQNPYTGMSYLYYTEYRLTRDGPPPGGII